MKCGRCGREIEEYEIFCDDCKKNLKKTSSKSDVKELENLIENQKKLTDLENTKELVNLNALIKEEIEKKEIIEEKTQVFEINNEIKENNQEVKNEKVEFSKKEKKSKKKLIIIISIISIVLIITLILLFVFFSKDNDDEIEKKEVIDYKKVINTYGNHIANIVKEYMESNEEIPTWQFIIEKLNYDKYQVECSNHNIYSDGSIYLSQCKVNNKQTKYTYGEEKEDLKKGKKINIYKADYDGYSIYSSETYADSTLVGTITCKTDDCEYSSAYDKYVLIKENNEYYLYDYTNDSINFGPFLFNSDYGILVDNDTLYGILFEEENKNNIYNVKTGRVLKDIKGTLLFDEMGFNPSIMYKYNYAVLDNDGKNDFVNLKTGNVSYSIKENIGGFIEDSTNKIVYITAYTSNPNRFKIYNSNGKSLFDGIEYSKFILGLNNLLVATDINFKVYDSDLKLKTNSKNYDEIIALYEDFVVASKDSNLIILSIHDEVLATFEDAWDKDINVFYNNLSGKDKDRIYLIVENKKIPSGTKGNCIEYYYIPSPHTSGFIEKSSIE